MSASTGRSRRWVLGGVIGVASLVVTIGPLTTADAGAGAASTLLGYNAATTAIGAQFAFNLPNVVPLPDENIVEEDAPFARTNVSDGPVVNSVGAPYYPGDVAANLGGLLAEFGAPSSLPNLNDTLLAQSEYPSSPTAPGQASFGVAPANATPLLPSIFSSDSDASGTGGDATATVSSLALDALGSSNPLTAAISGALSGIMGSGSTTGTSLIDVGNVSSSTSVALGASSITSTAITQVQALDIAGLIDISALTSTAGSTSDGTTGTPTATLHLGQVTVDGQSAYINATGVHITATDTPSTGITPAQLQQTVDATLAQDGISIAVLSPQLTTNGAQASADAGGLQIAISHQIDVPYIPGEPTIPLPDLGNEGLPAGLYTATTSITFGFAQASVSATNLPAQTTTTTEPSAALSTSPGSFGGAGTGSFDSYGETGSFGAGSSVQTVAPTGPGSAAVAVTGTPAPVTAAATDFPIRGVPAPLGWAITLLIGCLIMSYPLLLLARWQFVTPRRR